MKKLFALLLALTMVFSLATTAFADEATGNTITVNKAVENETYKLYKMFDLVVDDDLTEFTYTVNSAWTAFFAAADEEAGTEAGAGYQYVTINNGVVTAIEHAADLAKAAADYAEALQETGSKVADATEVVEFTGLDNGYYLITSTLGTVAMTASTPSNQYATIDEKNPEDTIEKTVLEDSTQQYGKSNDAQVGDPVDFKSIATLHPNTTNVKIHDTMDGGLTYNNDVKIYTDADRTVELNSASYTVLATPDAGDTFTIQFTEAYLASLTAETKLYLKYTAVLNAGAVVTDENGVAIVDQNNKTTITYGDKQSVEDKTTTTTHKSTVNKYAAGIEKLAGAVFSLKKNGTVVPLVKLDDINYRVATADEVETTNTFTTVEDGDIVIWGLDTDDDYTLEEITAPDGYNKLADEVDLEVNATNSSVTKVENKSGTELPSTGGMGTTLFYIVGGLMVAGAAILLVTKKRMGAEA